MAWNDSVADDALIGVEIAAGARIVGVVGKSGRRKGFEGVGDKDLELGGVVDGAPLANVPIGVGASGDGLGLDGRGMECFDRDFFGHHIQKIVGLNSNVGRIHGIRIGKGLTAFTRITWLITKSGAPPSGMTGSTKGVGFSARTARCEPIHPNAYLRRWRVGQRCSSHSLWGRDDERT